MKNLSGLADLTLLENTKRLASEERRLCLEVIAHLREISRRRLFAELGYPSLLEYCVRELGYSESSAYRRIQAMRLIQDVPEVKEKIESGAISLTVAAQAQSFFKQEEQLAEPMESERKKAILLALEGKSSREAERELLGRGAVLSNALPDRARVLSSEYTEIRFVADQELMADLEKIRGLLAHRYSNLTWRELMECIVEIALTKLDPSLQKCRTTAPAPEVELNGQRKTIPAAVRREVWKRDAGKCSSCGSRFALQIDHLKPVALGGSNEISNLRLLCRSCNQRAAIAQFGIAKMEKYLEN